MDDELKGDVGSLLTDGGILELIETEGHFSGRYVKQPTLQIINIRRVPANALTDVYWVSLRISSANENEMQ